MNIEWNEVVEPAKGPREREIESLETTIIRSSFVGTFFLSVGIGAVIFVAYHLNQPQLELDSFIGKILSGTTILSTVMVVVFFSKAINAWKKKNCL